MPDADAIYAEMETTARDQAFLEVSVNHVTASARAQGLIVACDTCTDPACCEQPVIISRGEALLLADTLRAHGRATVRRVRLRIRRWRRAGMDRLAHNPTDRAAARAYSARQHPCPLLEDGRCLAYNTRPAVCRTYVCLGEPAACRQFGCGEVESVVSIDVPQMYAVEREVARQRGFESGLARFAGDGPLPSMLETAFEELP